MTARAALVRPAFWVAALLAATLVVSFLTRPEGVRSSVELRSSFRATPDGTAAIFRALERLGLDAAQRLTPMADADPVRGTVVLLDPVLPPSPREVSALLDHVRAGGALVYSPRYTVAPQPRQAAASPLGPGRTPLMDSLGLGHRYRSAREDFHGDELVVPSWEEHPLTRGLGPPRPLRHGLSVEPEAGPESGSAGSAPVRDLLATTDVERWSAASEIELGEGRVLVLSESGALSNEMAAEDPVAALFVRALAAYTEPGDTVFFDEYHLGISSLRSRAEMVRDFFTATPGGRALLQLVLVGALALAAAGARFGAPAPAEAPPDRERRSPLEHASALGDLYRKAGASRTAALLLAGSLARAFGRRQPRNLEQAGELLRELDPGGSASLRPVRRSLESASPDLVRIARGIDSYISGRRSK